MKKLTLLVLTAVFLVGCNYPMHIWPEQLQMAETYCADHGGLRHINTKGSFRDPSLQYNTYTISGGCADGSEFFLTERISKSNN